VHITLLVLQENLQRAAQLEEREIAVPAREAAVQQSEERANESRLAEASAAAQAAKRLRGQLQAQVEGLTSSLHAEHDQRVAAEAALKAK
jgi:hypothetical protein